MNAPSELYVPVLDWRFGLSLGFYLLLFLIVAGAANGANLTDGIDGLAAGIGIIALLTLTAMNVVAYTRSGQFQAEQDLASLDMAILGAALIGGAIGFLWYNAFPAEVQMGDTGSMAIGGAIGAFAVMSRSELLLLLIGGIFVIEALSVILQVFSFKYWGRRIFLMAPIHHHFEMKAWSETKIMVRFWIVAAILCGAAFALYYRYFPAFRPTSSDDLPRARPGAVGPGGCAGARESRRTRRRRRPLSRGRCRQARRGRRRSPSRN